MEICHLHNYSSAVRIFIYSFYSFYSTSRAACEAIHRRRQNTRSNYYGGCGGRVFVV